jgi:hypothetical protein
MKMVFQNNSSRNQTSLDIMNKPPVIFPTSNNPTDSLRQNIIKPKKNFSAFKNGPTAIVERSINMFQTGMIQNVSGPNNNCSSCGGAK